MAFLVVEAKGSESFRNINGKAKEQFLIFEDGKVKGIFSQRELRHK
jgi:hypothetical protein